MGVADPKDLVRTPLDKREAQDAHERAVATRPVVGRAGIFGACPGLDGSEGRSGHVADIESPVVVGRVGLLVEPRHSPTALVSRIESGRQEQIEQREHERPVVAPRPGRLTPDAAGCTTRNARHTRGDALTKRGLVQSPAE